MLLREQVRSHLGEARDLMQIAGLAAADYARDASANGVSITLEAAAALLSHVRELGHDVIPNVVQWIFTPSTRQPTRPVVQLINWLQPADASAKALKCDVSDGRFSGKCVIFRHRASESLATDAHHIVRLLHYKVSKGVCAVFELECVGQSIPLTSPVAVIGEPVAEYGSWRAEALAEEKAKLAGGFRVGERVVSLIDHAPVGVSRGDVGTAVGPSADARAADHAVRLSVDFGKGKGRANLLGSSQLVSEAEWPKRQKEDAAKVFAAGGWRIGDYVLSTVDVKEISLKKGDVGRVAGPSTAAYDGDRVFVDFGVDALFQSKKKRRNAHKDEIEHEKKVPPGGWREGDRVAALFQSPQQNVSYGDVGTVVGPCTNMSLDNIDELVCVQFGAETAEPSQGLLNCRLHELILEADLPARRVEDAAKLLSLGGWHAGDRVVSNVDHGKIAKGDVGIIYSPCAERLDRWDERVSVDFGVDKGSAALIGIGLQSEAQWLARKEENAARLGLEYREIVMV